MKKLLLLLLLSSGAGANAQTLLQENFNSLATPIVLPTGWAELNLSSPIGTNGWFAGNTASFTAFDGPDNGYIAVNFQSGTGVSTLNNWLMTPTVTVQNGDEISFYTRVPASSSWADRLELRQSVVGASSTNPSGLTNVGSYTTLCLTVNPNLVAADYPQTWTKFTYVVAGLTGQVSSRYALRYTVPDGGPSGNNSNYVGVDALQVKRPITNDVSLNSVSVPAYLLAGNFTFTGQVQNQGTNAVTSYQVSWQANGGTVNSYTVTSVNIAPGASHTFTHSLPLSAVVSQTYALNFNVSTVNGVADGDPSNNSFTASAQVPSGSTTFKTMIEKFTGSTCPPCASYNNATFNPFYTAQNQNFNYVAYHQNFPGTGDPYYTAESGARRAYYGINAITSLRIDGADYSTGNNQATITAYINAQNAKTAYFALTGTRNFTGNTAAINYSITPYLSGNYVLNAVVYEKTTTGNIGTNGETQFKHVMMKMVPNASGTPLTLTAGTSVTGSISATLAGTNVEQLTDCEVVLFLQDPVTKAIVQSFTALDALSTPTNNLVNSIKLYPNPSSSTVRISNVEQVDVQVTDLLGKVVLNLKDVTNQTDINVSELQSGVYLFTVQNQTGSATIKFVKK
jgi:hypothetical protein